MPRTFDHPAAKDGVDATPGSELHLNDAQLKVIELWLDLQNRSGQGASNVAMPQMKRQAVNAAEHERARVAKMIAETLSFSSLPSVPKPTRDETALLSLLGEMLAVAHARSSEATVPAAADLGPRAAAMAEIADALISILRKEMDRHMQAKLGPLTHALQAALQRIDSGEVAGVRKKKAPSKRKPLVPKKARG